jgi:hypothetical protein
MFAGIKKSSIFVSTLNDKANENDRNQRINIEQKSKIND